MGRDAAGMFFPEEPPVAAAGAPLQGPKVTALPALVSRSSSALDKARTLTIGSQADLTAADTFRQDIMELLRTIDETFDPQIARAHALHKSLLAEKKKFTDPPNQALAILKPKIADYIEAQDRARLLAAREKELKLQEAKRLNEKAVDKAWDLVDKDKAGEAEAVLEEAAAKVGELEASAPAVPEKPQADVSLRTIWDFEVTDAEKIPRKYLVPDLVTIGKIVRATKDQTDIPGIRVFPKTTVADKGRRS